MDKGKVSLASKLDKKVGKKKKIGAVKPIKRIKKVTPSLSAKEVHHIVSNPYEQMGDIAPKYINTDPDMPIHPYRVSCAGVSGSGKSSICCSLIAHCGIFEKILIVTANPDEPLYRVLAENNPGMVEVTEDMDGLPPLEELDDSEQRMIIFDDQLGCSTKIQKRIIQYFLQSRKKNCSCIYISQNFFGIPMDIRKNSTHVIITRLNSETDFREIGRRLLGIVNSQQLKDIYKHATTPDEETDMFNSFLMIDLMAPPETMFSKGFDSVYVI